jgi:uroporphyrinogen decarboxylase
VLNWSHKIDVAEAFEASRGKLCLMGNVAPLDVGVRGSTADVESAGRAVMAKSGGGRLILSLGGGVSPGMPLENVTALGRALR